MLLTGGADFGFVSTSLSESAQTLLENANDFDTILEGAKNILSTKMIHNSVDGNIVSLVVQNFEEKVVKPALAFTDENAAFGKAYKNTADLAVDLEAQNKSVLGG